MCISNEVRAKLSYLYQSKIQTLFKNYVKGNLLIDYFSINFFFSNGRYLFLSPTPEMAEDLCKNQFVFDDTNYKPEVYKQLQIYPWRSVQRKSIDKIINFIKEERYGMRNRMMFVKDLGRGCNCALTTGVIVMLKMNGFTRVRAIFCG